jgi:hypothetical protein
MDDDAMRRGKPSCHVAFDEATAILAGGCFWGMQDLIRRLPGVLKTRVGYSGGDVPNATYRNHGTHAEAIEIIFDPEKLRAVADAVEGGHQPVFYAGYGDVWLEDGELHAQARDGNHRTFGAMIGGASPAYLIIMSNTLQDLEEPFSDKLYRAIRRAQREAGIPQWKRRRKQGRRKVAKKHLEPLLEAERAVLTAQEDIDKARRYVLQKFSDLTDAEISELDSYGLRVRTKLLWQNLSDEDLDTVAEDEMVSVMGILERQREQAWSRAYDLRQAAGLDPRTQRLDPETGQVVPA